MITLGLDLSIRATGYCVIDGSEVKAIGTIRTPGPKKACKEERIDIVCIEVATLVSKWQPDLVAIEGAAWAVRGGNAAFHLGELNGVIKHHLWLDERPFVEISPSALKKFATGKGNAAKDEMVVSARSWWDVQDDDEADALHLARLAAERYDELIEPS